ncbi:MAG TPA: SH3 domain-containing protein [Pirellulales bacterium]|nr:SH3 domain-containing protein [Pirellulales bacterium]
MTLRLAIVACVVLCVARVSAEQFPYTAHVKAQDVYIRSGPGESYYAVAKLERGQQVEVYRHDPGGWCAIRPPAECFSWVSAEFIEPRRGNVGVVTGDRVVARVGSAFSDTRDVIQVRLDRGEEVEILEAQEFNPGPASQTWYKILPPAGEFRWISGQYLDRELAEPERRQSLPDNNRLRDRKNKRRKPGEEEAEDVARGHDEDEEDSDGDDVRRVNHDEPTRRPNKGAPARSRLDPDDHRGAANEDIDEEEVDDTLPTPIRPEQRRPKADLKEEAQDLDLALSAVVTDEPARWDFTVLRRQAEDALSRAETALERGRIRRVLRKIDNFAEIRQRYMTVMNTHGTGGRRVTGADADRLQLGARSPLATTRYDGVGRLTQISSVDPRLPQFALVDSSGQVAAYVSPAPGINLRRYLDQNVGINGTRGYLPERDATHLTAKRIVPVETSLDRDPLR